MNRREFLRFSGTLAASAMMPAGFVLAVQPKSHDFELNASQGNFQFTEKQQAPASVYYYNESIPGPVIRLKQNQPAHIAFTNKLKESTSVHWHGLRIDNAMDGVPGMTSPLVEPGKSFDYVFTPPDAGTYWYHSHQRAWMQMDKGLEGILIVEEDNPPQVDQDYLFVIDDWLVDNQLQLETDSLGSMHDWAHQGRLGNIVTVNGQFEPVYAVQKGERVRLRLINIANSRTMLLRFNHGDPRVIAIDGQPVEPYGVSEEVILLASGQRMDLVLDMMDEPGSQSPIELIVNGRTLNVASFHYGDKLKRVKPLEAAIALPPNPLNQLKLDSNAAKQLTLNIEGGAMGGLGRARYKNEMMSIRELVQKHQKIWAFNGVAGLSDEPLFQVKKGQTVEIELNNDNNWPHAIHIHGHHFQVDDKPGIWRDTMFIDRMEKKKISFVADNPGKWLIHCHMIEHQAGGMVTWFQVT